jgi:hypothetical protein
MSSNVDEVIRMMRTGLAGPVSGLAPADVAADVEQISPNVPITASQLSVRFLTGFRSGFTNLTLEVNGVDSALTCGGSALHIFSCTDLTHTVLVPPAATLSFKVGNNSFPGDVIISWIAELTPGQSGT